MLLRPQARSWFAPACAGIFIGIVWWIFTNIISGSGPWLELTRFAFGVFALFFLGLAAVEFVWYNLERHNLWLADHNEAAAISPLVVAARAVAGLTKEQAELVPSFRGDMELGKILAEHGPHFVYHSPLGDIEETWFDDFLRHSSYTELPAEREYCVGPNREAERIQHRRAVSLLVALRLAYEAVGNKAPLWADGDARGRAMMMAGIEEAEAG